MSQDTEAVVLLVEDDPDHAELVVRALAEPRGSVRLVHVPNGVSALEYLMREGSWSDPAKSPRPDLRSSRPQAPRDEWGEVLRRIKSSGDFGGIPVVILSTSEARGELPAAEGTQANERAVKPVDRRALPRAGAGPGLGVDGPSVQAPGRSRSGPDLGDPPQHAVDFVEGRPGLPVGDLDDLGPVLLQNLAIPGGKLRQDTAHRPLARLQEVCLSGL